MERKGIGRIAKLNHVNAGFLNEDVFLSRKATLYKKRETAFAESQFVTTLAIRRNNLSKFKGIFYRMGLKADYLNIEAAVKRSALIKKNTFQI